MLKRSALLLLLISIFLVISSTSVSAFTIGAPQGFGVDPGTETGDNLLGTVISNAIRIIFIIGAIGFLAMFLWGAVSWIFSGGEKEAVGNARKRITQAIIGFVLLALVFLIARVLGSVIGFNPLQEFTLPSLTQTTTDDKKDTNNSDSAVCDQIQDPKAQADCLDRFD